MALFSARTRDSIRMAIRKDKSEAFASLAKRHICIDRIGSLQNMFNQLSEPKGGRTGKIIRTLLAECKGEHCSRLASDLLLWATLPAVESYCQHISDWFRTDAEQAGCLAILECAQTFKAGSARDSQVFAAFVKRVIACIRDRRATEAKEARVWRRYSADRSGGANDNVERVARDRRIKFDRGEWNQAASALRSYCTRHGLKIGVEALVATSIKGLRFEDFVRENTPADEYQRVLLLSRQQKARLVRRLRAALNELHASTAPVELSWLSGANDDIPMVRLLGLVDEVTT